MNSITYNGMDVHTTNYDFVGILADGIGDRFQISVGRGAAAVIMMSGLLLGMMALTFYPIETIRKLENREEVNGEESDETKNHKILRFVKL